LPGVKQCASGGKEENVSDRARKYMRSREAAQLATLRKRIMHRKLKRKTKKRSIRKELLIYVSEPFVPSRTGYYVVPVISSDRTES
jgi:hypothetical protein